MDGVPLHENKRKEHGIQVQRVSNLTESAIFTAPEVLSALSAKLWNYGWDLDTMPRGGAILASHKDRELTVNLVMALLEEIGYRADSFGKYRSRMHDITHATYAAAGEVFVTEDRRFRQRVRATYNFLEITTKVLSVDELLAQFPSTA